MLVRELLPIGRLGRAGFWWRHLLVLPVALFLCVGTEQLLGRGPGLAASIATTLFLVSVWGRRLHDRGRSAWWLIAVAVPVVGALALVVECGLRGSRMQGERFGASPALTPDYATV